MKRVLAILSLVAVGSQPAQAALEWAVWGPPSGNSSTGVFGNDQQVMLEANFTDIANGEPAGQEYTSSPQVPGRPDNTNPPFQRVLTGPPSTFLPAGTPVVALDLSGITVAASTTFGLADHKTNVYYILQLRDASLALLPLTGVAVTKYNITYTNGGLIADLNTALNTTSAPGRLTVDSIHDAGGTYSHTGLTTFSNLPTGTRYITLLAEFDNQEVEGLQIYLATDTGSGGCNAVNGTAGADTLEGAPGKDCIDGKAGADSMSGLGGDDSYIVDNTGDTVIEGAGGGTDTIESSVTYSLPIYVENLTLTGTAVINGSGNGLNNVLTGNALANTLDGKAGADEMTGGAGNDTYVVDNPGDATVETSGGGVDTVNAAISWTLLPYTEKLTLTGSAHLHGTGNNQANTLTGNSGHNVLDGKSGADTMRGGAGNDRYRVDNPLDVVTENAHEGIDTVRSTISYTLPVNVEKLTLAAPGAVTGTGNGVNNTITGYSNDNTLVGGGANDTLNGGLGNDTLTGGSGSDRYYFATALGAGNVDTITDYNVAADTLLLDDAVFTMLAVGTLPAAAFRTGAAANTTAQRIIYNSATGSIAYDPDGTGAAPQVPFAIVTPGLALTNADFVVQ